MFFLFAIFAGIFGGGKKPTPPPAGILSDVNFPRSEEGSPITRIYGTVKFKAPNTIWSGDFESRPRTKKVSTGLFSSRRETIGYTYYIGLDLAVCMGPGFTFRRIWAGTYELWNGCLTSCENVIKINQPKLFGGDDKGGGFTGDIALYCGNYNQNPDPYLQSKLFPGNVQQVPAYNGTAHMVFRHCNFGTSTSIQPIYIEGSCFPDTLNLGKYLIMPNGLDMNPIGILHHIYSDDWGSLDVDPAKINEDQWRDIAAILFNEGNGASLLVNSAGTAQDVAKSLLNQINATTFQDPSTGKYNLVLIRNDYDVASLPVFGPDQILSIENFTKTLWSQTFNTVRVKFTDRHQDYKDDVAALAQDFAQVRFQKKVISKEVTMIGCYEPGLATALAARELSNVNVPLYYLTMTLNRNGTRLPPGSVFVFNWPEYNIVGMVLRVRKLGLGTFQDGTVTMDVVQDVFSAATPVIAAPVASPIDKPDKSPLPIINSILFELPYWLDYNAGLRTVAGYQSLGVFTNPPSINSQYFNVYANTTQTLPGINVTDSEVLHIAPYAPHAMLLADLGRWDGFDNGFLQSLTVSTVSNPLVLQNGDPRKGSGLFYLNGELMAYQTFVINEDGTTTLNSINRALLDTSYTAAKTGDFVYFFDGQASFLEGSFYLGNSEFFKFADNTSSSEYANPVPIEFRPLPRLQMPLPPDGLTVNGIRNNYSKFTPNTTVTVAWYSRSSTANPLFITMETEAINELPVGDPISYVVQIADTEGNVLATHTTGNQTYDLLLDPTLSGDVVIQVFAVAAFGISQSYTPALYPISIYKATEIDGNRIMIDGNGIII